MLTVRRTTYNLLGTHMLALNEV